MRHHQRLLVEQQFVTLLSMLTAEDALLDRYLAVGTRDQSQALGIKLTSLRAELAALDNARRRVYGLYESDVIPRAEVERRLAEILTDEREKQEHAMCVEAELSRERVVTVTLESARALLAHAGENWQTANVDDQRALARAISSAIGPLTVSFDGILSAASRTADPIEVCKGGSGTAGCVAIPHQAMPLDSPGRATKATSTRRRRRHRF